VSRITKDDQFILLACDGLFDVFTNEDVVAFVRENMEQHQDAQKCCQVMMLWRICIHVCNN
jgi:protein phosphatase 2C family protein 2/3